ncbi:glycosyltransferase family 2 protein [Agarilytica rhodophyticola]|uniref:glycosyltransferase family 2 protein n=1 Tax=Agarilytica rhodophyticola TaxID=1737490 RepID=UPI000B3470DF|nr:glycosyltransferase family 2 protein [Agarilytica rhodophyticola]
MERQKLSCFIIVCNEADRIEPCLQSLAGWVDQLIILDSGSTDGTVEIAQRYTQEVYQTDWPGFGPQRNRALAKCRYDWVLNIDADERMTEELRDEIDKTLSQPHLNANLIQIPWRTFLFGKALRFGRYSSPQGKLFKREGVAFKDRQVHETLLIPNEVALTLKAPLLHFSWRSYQHVQEKHLKYACLLAQQKFDAGKRSSIKMAVIRFFLDFLQQYILRLGFLDGWRGFLMAVILGQYAFHKYAALVALQNKDSDAK